MRTLRTAILAGIATLGVAGAAVAASHATHSLAVDLPDGSVARIDYSGDVAPKVTIEPALHPLLTAAPFDAVAFAPFDRVFADLERQQQALLQQARTLPLRPGGAGLNLAALGALPPGTVSYSFVSTSDGSHVCSRSWQVSAPAAGQAPKVVEASSGDCAGDRAGPPRAVAAHAAGPVAPLPVSAAGVPATPAGRTAI
jgi:hypothetical protein